MAEYHVIKIDVCPACLGQKPDPFCGKCNGSGRIQSVASFEEALKQSSAGKKFQNLIENINAMLEKAMAATEAMITSAFENKKGMH